ncbi:STAS domain-containing protein [Amycolatopsis rubida]|uniref:STAS domain-containing protein n=1 Tax=Amycolatopsis rubida TaxID=112413 RepID=A0ABX0C156_9PSEU|nr:STAS domain-containing protein [Amycolatopsis rubida]NEC59192.1 STAS domain-containing protein [Amycolatopsis rubida]
MDLHEPVRAAVVTGPPDPADACGFAERLAELVGDGGADLVIDLSDSGTMSSAGVRVVLAFACAAGRAGRRVRIVTGEALVTRLVWPRLPATCLNRTKHCARPITRWPPIVPSRNTLVTATRGGDFDEAAHLLSELAAGAEATRTSVSRDLVRRCAGLVCGRFGPQPEVVFTAVAVDETALSAEVDELDPGVRAVLAELNGDLPGLACQLDLAARDSGLAAIVRCLRWTVEPGDG